MTELADDRTRSFGYADFDLARVDAVPGLSCPIRGCSAALISLPYGKKENGDVEPKDKKTMPWCPAHGIQMHSHTFVYWNGDNRREEPRLRNFMVEKSLAAKIAFAKYKAETHRLGYEMSEDALSWNVFVSLAAAGKLKDAAEWLTGRNLSTEPSLYLWGSLIENQGGEPQIYPALQKVRESLEGDIKHFLTEPDIMLVVKGEMVICIEAKFGSGNPLAYLSDVKAGEKPTSGEGLLERYLGAATTARTKAAIHRENIGSQFHGQLFRNIVFASEMAEKDWHIVNLVSKTQKGTKDTKRESFSDPTADVRRYLSPQTQSCFTYRTWEDLYAMVIKDAAELAEVGLYMRGKSAHYRPAFHLA